MEVLCVNCRFRGKYNFSAATVRGGRIQVQESKADLHASGEIARRFQSEGALRRPQSKRDTIALRERLGSAVNGIIPVIRPGGHLPPAQKQFRKSPIRKGYLHQRRAGSEVARRKIPMAPFPGQPPPWRVVFPDDKAATVCQGF